MVQNLGLFKALSLAIRMQFEMVFNNPFNKINKEQAPSAKAKLSQRQMGPVLVIYDILRKDGFSEEEAIDFLKKLSHEVAVEFLKFNIPDIEKNRWANESRETKLGVLQKITSRFFNAEADIHLDDADNFSFNVNKCYFAYYAKELGYQKLAPIFCASDKFFFDRN